MTLRNWARAQVWWKYVELMLQDGLYVMVHVRKELLPELPKPAKMIIQKSTGGVCVVDGCELADWHIAMVTEPKALDAIRKEVGKVRGWADWIQSPSDEVN